MKIKTFETINEIIEYLKLEKVGHIFETDIDDIETECDLFNRKRKDAELLTTIAANIKGKCLDIGTSYGKSAYKIATNAPKSIVYTINVLPHEIKENEKHITHLLEKNDIGKYYKDRKIKNIIQLYGNTQQWKIPEELNHISMVFIDGNHDANAVYSDSNLVYQNIEENGYIVWHDFNPDLRNKYEWIDSAMKGVENFIKHNNIETEIIHLKNSWTGVFKKTSNKIFIESTSKRSKNKYVAMNCLRYLWTYPAYSKDRIHHEENIVSRIKKYGYNIESFPIPCPQGWLSFQQLDKKVKDKEKSIQTIYEELIEKCTNIDVMISSGGAMLHPDVIFKTKTYNVYICADDPESSSILSEPVAPYFDFCFTTNIACVDTYKSWGCKNVSWLFHALRPGEYDAKTNEDTIASKNIDISMFCENIYKLSDRNSKIEKLLNDFPQAIIRGKGWPKGFVSKNEMFSIYQKTKIGWNIHNSIGPTNTRLYTLPGFGILQICDNKKNLNEIFTVDKEIVGFDSINECVDKTKYYLSRNNERIEIAINGWKRVNKDYTEIKQWEKILSSIEGDYKNKSYADTKITYCANINKQSHTSNKFCNEKDLPKILFLVDKPGWAYDISAKSIQYLLKHKFEITIKYVVDNPVLNSNDFDLLFVFFWGETYHRKFNIDPKKVIKQISSHRWEEKLYGSLTPEIVVKRYLNDAATITCTSNRLASIFSSYTKIKTTPNGFNQDVFHYTKRRYGKIKIGWAGNSNDPCKGLNDIIIPAIDNNFEFQIANGSLHHDIMNSFYNSIDLLCIASTAEGEPLTLLEGMGCGCFPVCVDVGIVPELIKHKQNGLIIERSQSAFKYAFQWAAKNLTHIRNKSKTISFEIAQKRSWQSTIAVWENLFKEALTMRQNSNINSTVNNIHKHNLESKLQTEDEINKNLKSDYHHHFKKMNPGNSESTYKASCFYYNAEILPNLPSDTNAKILDAGSGLGHLLRFLHENRYINIYGVEIDKNLHNLSTLYTKKYGLTIYLNDLNKFLENQFETYDMVLAIDIIEHFDLNEAVFTVKNIYNSLKKNGKALFRTPNMANIFGVYSRYMDLTHRNGFTEFSLAQLLREAGFAASHLHIPQWDSTHPLTHNLMESRDFHRKLFNLQDRVTPNSFDKNITMLAIK
mgnify:CR=1 FL=1